MPLSEWLWTRWRIEITQLRTHALTYLTNSINGTIFVREDIWYFTFGSFQPKVKIPHSPIKRNEVFLLKFLVFLLLEHYLEMSNKIGNFFMRERTQILIHLKLKNLSSQKSVGYPEYQTTYLCVAGYSSPPLRSELKIITGLESHTWPECDHRNPLFINL